MPQAKFFRREARTGEQGWPGGKLAVASCGGALQRMAQGGYGKKGQDIEELTSSMYARSMDVGEDERVTMELGSCCWSG